MRQGGGGGGGGRGIIKKYTSDGVLGHFEFAAGGWCVGSIKCGRTSCASSGVVWICY